MKEENQKLIVLTGKKGLTSLAKGDFSHLDIQGMPHNDSHNFHLTSILNKQISFNARAAGNAIVRHISWSPAGCSATGGCVLASVTSDHRVTSLKRAHESTWSRLPAIYSLTDCLGQERLSWQSGQI